MKHLLAGGLLVVLTLLCAPWRAAARPAEVLTNAVDVLALSAERALQAVPVSLRGVVTAAEKYWDGRFFVQDPSGGVFVDNISLDQPEPGDVVEVTGVSHPGAFAPVVSRPIWRKVGTAPLPRASAVPIERLMSGLEDGQRIEIAGILRAVRVEHALLSAEIVSGGYRVQVFAKLLPGVDLSSLLGAAVRVRGTAAASFNARLRRLITMKVFAPLAEDFVVELPEAGDPFARPLLPLNSIAQYRRNESAGKRVHVKGVVTHQRPGEDIFLQDATGGLHVKSRELERFAVGEVIEAVGFANLDRFLPVLEDAVCRKTGETGAGITAKPATVEELRGGFHHADVITLEARVLDRAVRRAPDPVGPGMQIRTVLMLQGVNGVFTAEMQSSNEPLELLAVPIGSSVEVTGICLSEIDQEGKLKLLSLLMTAPKSVRVLAKPGWLTPQRLTVGLGALLAVLLLALSWTIIISKKNAALKVLVVEKESAQRQLQEAHDELEARVKERTEELKLQITARKESELQFKAVLTERTRLAQELHDTLEQTLTGIALQMDTAARLFEKKPGEANHHLELARNLVGQGQVEVRRSVWDLRSRALEKFDLPNALTAIAQQMTDGTGIRVDVNAGGRMRALPAMIEDNLLRIAQEALTNVIKHSSASTASIELDYGPRNVFLRIKDNGRGFVTQDCAGPLNGHFGLLGMLERVKRINGQFVINSAPALGTVVEVQIPIESEPEVQRPSLARLDFS